MAALYEAGIGGILDYAAEDDVDAADGPASRSEPHGTVVARTYDYNTEAACDRHTSIFLRSIAAAAQGEGQGFAAIKVKSCCCKILALLVMACELPIGLHLSPMYRYIYLLMPCELPLQTGTASITNVSMYLASPWAKCVVCSVKGGSAQQAAPP